MFFSIRPESPEMNTMNTLRRGVKVKHPDIVMQFRMSAPMILTASTDKRIKKCIVTDAASLWLVRQPCIIHLYDK